MATTTFIPVEQYLATSYRPDCDYVDGEVQERNLGEHTHNLVQMMITKYLSAESSCLEALAHRRAAHTGSTGSLSHP